jgi:alpha-L-fucosidase
LALHTHRNNVLYQRDALQIGAKYVVITTKHHDGYCLWPTKVQNPHKTNYSSERDLVGDLAEAVRARSECFWEERKP